MDMYEARVTRTVRSRAECEFRSVINLSCNIFEVDGLMHGNISLSMDRPVFNAELRKCLYPVSMYSVFRPDDGDNMERHVEHVTGYDAL